MEVLVIIALLLVLGVLLFINSRELPKVVVQDLPHQRTCPLCGHGLQKGQSVKTRLVTLNRGSNAPGVQESVSSMLGCPFCWPNNATNPRTCPVCKVTLGPQDVVIGRYFERQGYTEDGSKKKNHVHVLGCSQCHG